MLRIFIGYDPNETVAFHVLANSIMRHASQPVQITPMILSQLPLTRKPHPTQSTQFSFSRFLVPWLCDFEGRAMFLDCDMLCRVDIAEIFDLAQGLAVSVVKHDYTPAIERKFLDQEQSRYPRKNWSSVMVFNNAMCARLTPDYVDSVSGLHLHQFKWTDDPFIGALPAEWNHLVGEYEPNPAAKLVHFTRGTPCFKKFSQCEFSLEWFAEHDYMQNYTRLGEYSMPLREEA